jgi:hypothetical protein
MAYRLHTENHATSPAPPQRPAGLRYYCRLADISCRLRITPPFMKPQHFTAAAFVVFPHAAAERDVDDHPPLPPLMITMTR